MRQILLLGEGQTEERFVKSVLAPHLETKDLHVVPIIVRTKRLPSGPKYRGGVSSWGKVEGDLRRLLGATHVAAVTTMIDLYALPSDSPGQPSQQPDPELKVTEIEAAMAEAIESPRFVPHLVRGVVGSPDRHGWGSVT